MLLQVFLVPILMVIQVLVLRLGMRLVVVRSDGSVMILTIIFRDVGKKTRQENNNKPAHLWCAGFYLVKRIALFLYSPFRL